MILLSSLCRCVNAIRYSTVQNNALLFAVLRTRLSCVWSFRDFPNAWPPLQHALCEAFARLGTPAGARAAALIHHRFLGSAMAAWRRTGVMHEKYDAEEVGGVGRGGEYEPQVRNAVLPCP